MASRSISLVPFDLVLVLVLLLSAVASSSDPIPTPWPERFHALVFMNLSGAAEELMVTDIWYDWPAGRNVNLMQRQLGDLLHNIEWNNGTSFYYTLGPSGTCKVHDFGVGIPRPDFLQQEAGYLGVQNMDGFTCNVWQKLNFIWYWEDINTKIPVRFDFYNGIAVHVMTFREGEVLERSQWQAPSHCFNNSTSSNGSKLIGQA